MFGIVASQRRFVYLAVTLLSAAGVWMAMRLPSAIYPELQFPRVTVLAGGSSLSAQQEVFSVTRPLEEALSTVLYVRRVDSKSIRGQTEIQMLFAPNTDMIYALQLVRAAIAEVQPELPAGVTVTADRITPSVYPIISYNVEGGDPAQLYDIARYQIRPIISRVPNVGQVEVQGSDVREVEVVADPARLAQHGLSYDAFASAISHAIAVNAIGRVDRDYQQFLVVTANEAHAVDDVANVVVAPGVRVRDLATVTLGTEDHTTVIAGDGRPAALINITRQIGGNTIAIADSVAGAMRAISAALPPGVHVKPVYDQSELVRDAVKAVRDAIIIGAALAIIILLLFLRHVRITAISAASIPLTMMITLFVMAMLGQTLNLMTLGAMAIAIGLVIDDAVVITENIVRHLHLNPDRTSAIREAVQELIWAVTSSTLTTVVVFLPLGLLEGVVGQFFKALSLTLTIAVLVSLVLAFTIIPLLSEQYVTERDAEYEPAAGTPAGRGVLHAIGRAVDALSSVYERALAVVLRHRAWVFGAGVVLIAAGYVTYRAASTGFLPEMDEGAFILDYWLPQGTSLAESDRELRQVEQIVAHVPEVSGTSRRLGAELGLFATQQNRGDITVRLVPPAQRRRTIFQVINQLRDTLAVAAPQVRIEFVQILSDALNDMAGVTNPVEIKLFGDNLDTLETYARSLDDPIGKVPGVEDLFDGVVDPTPELAVRVHEAQAARLGLTPDDVTSQASGALLGVPAGQMYLDDRVVGVRVRAPDSVRYDPANLGGIPIVPAGRGGAVPLASLASISRVQSRSELTRENQQQLVTMTSDLGDRALGDVIGDIKTALASHPAPRGVRVELGGQYESQQNAFRQMLLVLALAAASVVALMLLQFRSFVEPLSILLAAPLSFVGAMVLLLVTGTALNVSSLMGMILLVGLIVKNGIILLDFTRWRMVHNDMALEPAILDAARVRLRPILMTTLCTLFGLLPLALGIGAGSELQKPLALAVIGGLGLSTPITLFVVPTLVVAIRGREYRLPPEAA
ncbi:MAG TPA: efflux RND transporter permease subunit [Gemmatimonadaceae bacterium]|nr:efflux RND transporter permease subunit [Gemmatimonadaceae bacterium]